MVRSKRHEQSDLCVNLRLGLHHSRLKLDCRKSSQAGLPNNLLTRGAVMDMRSLNIRLDTCCS